MTGFKVEPPRRNLQVFSNFTMTAETLCSASEISRCRETWEKMQKHPNTDWEFYNLINKCREEVEDPCVLQLRNERDVVSVWAGRVERTPFELRLGYLRLGSLRARTLTIVTGGLMGNDSAEECRLLLDHAMQELPAKRLDALILSYVPCEHPLFTLAKTVPKWYQRDWVVAPTIHWRIALPDSFEEFLERRSRNHRQQLKKTQRALEKSFPGKVRIRLFQGPAEVDEFCRDAESISKKTYQHHLGEGFDNEQKARCKLFSRTGAFRGYVLYIEDQPSAFYGGQPTWIRCI